MLWWCCEWWINLISKVNAKCIIDKHNFRYVIQMQHGSKLILFSYFLDIEWYCIAFTRFRRFFLIMFIGVVFMLWFRFFLIMIIDIVGWSNGWCIRVTPCATTTTIRRIVRNCFSSKQSSDLTSTIFFTFTFTITFSFEFAVYFLAPCFFVSFAIFFTFFIMMYSSFNEF